MNKAILECYLKNDSIMQFYYKGDLYEPEIYCDNNVLSRKIDLTDDGYLHYRVVKHNLDDLLKDKNFSFKLFTKNNF